MSIRARLIPLILVVGLAAAACGDGDESAGPVAPTPRVDASLPTRAGSTPVSSAVPAPTLAAGPKAAAPAPASGFTCSFITPDLVKATLGLTTKGPVVVEEESRTSCEFGRAGDGRAQVTIQVNSSASAFVFEAVRDNYARNGAPIRTIAGLGDAAYLAVIGLGGEINTLAVLKGDREVLLASGVAVEKMRALMELILARA